jgi:hypothetical protein
MLTPRITIRSLVLAIALTCMAFGGVVALGRRASACQRLSAEHAHQASAWGLVLRTLRNRESTYEFRAADQYALSEEARMTRDGVDWVKELAAVRSETPRVQAYVDAHNRMKAAYAMAARWPWLPVHADPALPSQTDLQKYSEELLVTERRLASRGRQARP